MPARNARFRALKDEFRLFLDERAAWPPAKLFPAKLKSKGGGRKTDIFQMKNGGAVTEKYVIALVELIQNKPPLAEFLTRCGGVNQSTLTVDAIVDLVAGPVVQHAAPAPNADDWFLEGLDGLSKILTDYAWGELVREGTLCRDADDVETAVSMIFTCGGRHIAGGRRHLTAQEAIAVAEDYMRIRYDDYLRDALESWRAVPWTIAFSVIDRCRVGCSRILPLTDSVYEEVRGGHRTTHSCLARDLLLPSRSILIDTISEKPETEYPLVGKRTAQQIRTMFVQIAHLTPAVEARHFRQGAPFRVLCIGGTPKDEVRARKFGFRPVGTKMPGFDIDIALLELDEQKGAPFHLMVAFLQWRLFPSG